MKKSGIYRIKPIDEGESAENMIKDHIVKNIDKIIDGLRSTGMFTEQQLRINRTGDFKDMASGTGTIAQQYVQSLRNALVG